MPSSKGGFVSADPVQLCIKYKPPTIAVVYEILRPAKGGIGISMSEQKSSNLTTAESTMINGQSPNKKRKKHIHEIRLDDLIFRESTSEDLGYLCDRLF